MVIENEMEILFLYLVVAITEGWTLRCYAEENQIQSVRLKHFMPDNYIASNDFDGISKRRIEN